MITNILSGFDLNEKEIKVFYKVLELWGQPASNIARILELPRNTIRSILDGLVKKHLLIKTSKANTQYYSVESKKNLIRHLKHQKIKIQEKYDDQINLLEDCWDEFDLQYKSKSRPKITFYEWKDGLEKVYEDTLTARSDIKSWASFEWMHWAMPEYFKTYYKKRAKKKITIHSIHPDTDFAKERQPNNKEELRDSILVDHNKYTWTPEIQVYDNKINISSWKEKLWIIIESSEIAELMTAIFNISFDATKKITKK